MKIIVTSFYKYVNIKNLDGFQEKHLEFCKNLGVKGKVLISKEGINGSVSGNKEHINKYKNEITKNRLFNDLIFKDNSSHETPFKKTVVRIRNEIVTSGLNVNLRNRGKYISPEELNKLIENNENFVLVDARNDYESKIGKFKNAITPNIETFREFKNFVKELEKYKNKKIVTYCTGGVRCEKASAFLNENGFENVFQLEGGILNYINQFPDKYFEGRCFVFDNRLSIASGVKSNEISFCEHCHVPCGIYINCSNKKCDKLFISCNECNKKYKNTCSKNCRSILNSFK